MKAPQFLVTVVLAVVPLILVINLIFLGEKNQALQTQLQAQQEDINKGAMSQQVGINLLKEIAQASVNDDKLRDVLTKSGFKVNFNPGATATPTP